MWNLMQIDCNVFMVAKRSLCKFRHEMIAFCSREFAFGIFPVPLCWWTQSDCYVNLDAKWSPTAPDFEFASGSFPISGFQVKTAVWDVYFWCSNEDLQCRWLFALNFGTFCFPLILIPTELHETHVFLCWIFRCWTLRLSGVFLLFHPEMKPWPLCRLCVLILLFIFSHQKRSRSTNREASCIQFWGCDIWDWSQIKRILTSIWRVWLLRLITNQVPCWIKFWDWWIWIGKYLSCVSPSAEGKTTPRLIWRTRQSVHSSNQCKEPYFAHKTVSVNEK